MVLELQWKVTQIRFKIRINHSVRLCGQAFLKHTQLCLTFKWRYYILYHLAELWKEINHIYILSKETWNLVQEDVFLILKLFRKTLGIEYINTLETVSINTWHLRMVLTAKLWFPGRNCSALLNNCENLNLLSTSQLRSVNKSFNWQGRRQENVIYNDFFFKKTRYNAIKFILKVYFADIAKCWYGWMEWIRVSRCLVDRNSLISEI